MNPLHLICAALLALFISSISSAQLVDLEKSEVIRTSKEQNGKIFRVKIGLKVADAGVQESQFVRKLSDIAVRRCVIDKKLPQISVQAVQSDVAGLEYNCDFDRKTVLEFGTFSIKLTFPGLTVDNQSLTATPQRNDFTIRAAIEDPVWFRGDNFVTLPITVDKSVVASVSVSCTKAPTTIAPPPSPVMLNKALAPNQVAIKLDGLVPGMACKASLSMADNSLEDIADVAFVDENGRPPTNSWTSTPSTSYQISVNESTGIKSGAVLITTFEAQPVEITTNVKGSMKMFIDDVPSPESQSDQNLTVRTFTISPTTILKLKSTQQTQHRVRFEGRDENNSALKELTFPIIVDINPKILISKIALEPKPDQKKPVLVVTYTLDNPIETRISIEDSHGVEIEGFKELVVTCSGPGNRLCRKEFDILTTDFIKSVATSVDKALAIRVYAAASKDDIIGKIGFDVIKPQLDARKAAVLDEIANSVTTLPKSQYDQKKSELINRFSTEVLGNGDAAGQPGDQDAIRLFIEQLRGNTGQKNKFVSILKFAGRIGLAYFGLPAIF